MAKKKSTTKSSPQGSSGKAKKKGAAKPGKAGSSSVKKKASSGKKAGTAVSKGNAKKAAAKKGAPQKAASKKVATVGKSTSKVKKGAKVKKGTGPSGKASKSVAKKNGASKAKAAKRTAQAVESVEELAPEPVKPMRKTRLSAEELGMFRDMLLAKRAELVGDMTQLQDEALGRNRSESAGDVSSMPTHMADLGSDNWEQEFTLGLIENERSLIREIDEALDRIGSRTYGICMATNKIIRKARLRAKPWAKYCIDHARKRELGLVR